jgi:hypothetical protein
MHLMKPAAVYFALVFGAGFILGVGRVLWLVPRLGARDAELVEMPLMLVVITLAAGRTNRLFAGMGGPARLGYGGVALSLTLAADLAVAVFLRGMSPAAAFADRDPVSGAAYYGSLIVFALMPWLLGRGIRPHGSPRT